MIENISEIEQQLGLPEGEFKKLYDSKDKAKIDLSAVEIVKKADLETRMTNYANEVFEKKKSAVLEIYNKTVFRDGFGLTIDKTADPKELAVLAKERILADAKITPDSKVQELQSDLEKLRKNSSEWETKHNELLATIATEKKQSQVNNTIVSALPEKTKIPKEDLKLLFESKYKPVLSDDGKVLFHNEKGEVLKNPQTLNPMTIKEVMAEFQVPYVEGATGGSGGGDNPGAAKGGSYEAFEKEMAVKGFTPMSKEFIDEMKTRIANKTLKM